jgi:predicted nucleic acid-binding protein
LREVISNTSPLQYLHQVGGLDLLRTLVGTLVIPPAVVRELAEGRARGIDLPDPESLDWIVVRVPRSTPALPLLADLGPGEAEVLALVLESAGAVAILDDALARRMAESLHLPLTGTLGVLVDAKKAGLLHAVAPLLDSLDALGFRLASRTRAAVLALAGEAP